METCKHIQSKYLFSTWVLLKTYWTEEMKLIIYYITHLCNVSNYAYSRSVSMCL
jgi:hypothetical protein